MFEFDRMHKKTSTGQPLRGLIYINCTRTWKGKAAPLGNIFPHSESIKTISTVNKNKMRIPRKSDSDSLVGTDWRVPLLVANKRGAIAGTLNNLF